MGALNGFPSFPKGSVVAIVGCGGKTSLLYALAQVYQNAKTLISTTTKIQRPGHLPFVAGKTEGLPFAYVTGTPLENGKLGALDATLLAAHIKGADYSFLEADGSAGKPLKGWASYEPVIPPGTTHTVGVVSLGALGAVVGQHNTHRLPLFQKCTGAKAGEKVNARHLASMVWGIGGMMQQAKGEQIILINQVETKKQEAMAYALAIQLKQRGDPSGRYYIGSAQQGRFLAVP